MVWSATTPFAWRGMIDRPISDQPLRTNFSTMETRSPDQAMVYTETAYKSLFDNTLPFTVPLPLHSYAPPKSGSPFYHTLHELNWKYVIDWKISLKFRINKCNIKKKACSNPSP
ncbi:hypothetical protein AVEN_243569-1 [Araneus ventricosus]|uniref:Uncharacterized protein n=1 Tax=Araneus ventricosus TaxID=182803 RepID=A0A4Y2A4N8_ARAVE|nr:hypothetical protein AVEN_243569-1 [Araneus ventricosus]